MAWRHAVRKVCLGALLGCAWAWAQSPPPKSQGPGDLMVIPVRVILEGRQRAAEVMLKNQGKEPATYRVFVKEMTMTPLGQLEDREKAPGETTAADLIRYSPHQVELAPGEAQTVRIKLRKPDGLKDGEYRSHMVFHALPPAAAPQPVGTQDKALAIRITPVYGISIPVIVRHGETSASAALSGLRLWYPEAAGSPPVLGMKLERKGNRSLVGDFVVTLESGSTLKKGTVLTQINGVSVYPNLDFREVNLGLFVEKGASLQGARLKVVFTPRDIKQDPIVSFFDVP